MSGLGILVLAVLLGGLVSALPGGGGGERVDRNANPPAEKQEQAAGQQEQVPEQQQPQEQQQESPTAQIGQTVNVGDVAWRVTNAQPTNELRSQFGQFGNSKQGNFVIVDFVFTNKGNEAVTLDPISLALMAGDAIIGGLFAWAIAQGDNRTGVWGGGGTYQRVDHQS